MEPIPLTQTELQRMHDLSCSFTMTKHEFIELGELARRAVQMLVAQSVRIKQLKGILEPTKPAVQEKPFDFFDFLGMKF